MKTRNTVNRVIPLYRQWVEVPDRFKRFVWDAVGGKAPLEEMVLKILLYGKFGDIREIYSIYPDVVSHVANSYSEVHRDVKYWVRKWESERTQ